MTVPSYIKNEILHRVTVSQALYEVLVELAVATDETLISLQDIRELTPVVPYAAADNDEPLPKTEPLPPQSTSTQREIETEMIRIPAYMLYKAWQGAAVRNHTLSEKSPKALLQLISDLIPSTSNNEKIDILGRAIAETADDLHAKAFQRTASEAQHLLINQNTSFENAIVAYDKARKNGDQAEMNRIRQIMQTREISPKFDGAIARVVLQYIDKHNQKPPVSAEDKKEAMQRISTAFATVHRRRKPESISQAFDEAMEELADLVEIYPHTFVEQIHSVLNRSKELHQQDEQAALMAAKKTKGVGGIFKRLFQRRKSEEDEQEYINARTRTLEWKDLENKLRNQIQQHRATN